MKLTSLSIFCLCIQLAAAQRVVHHHYVTYYNAGKMEPDSVVWNLSPDMVSCQGIKRKDKFAPDPEIAGSARPQDYTGSHYDKGHMFPYADAACDPTDAVECFYMSNMLPQIHALNAGDWKSVEQYERDLASAATIHILAGGIGSLGTTASGVNIPQYCWKAIYAAGKWTCWIMLNDISSKGHDLIFWQVKDINDFDQKTGLNLH